MQSIAAYSPAPWQAPVQAPEVLAGRASGKGHPAPMGAHGDTVAISDEARELLAAKLEEYGARGPGDLTDAEHADLKRTMAEAEGVTDQDRDALDKAAERGREMAEKGKEEAAEAREAKAERQGPPSGGQGTSGEDSDDIEDLKDDIDEAEEAIEELSAKAAGDDAEAIEAREELKAKRIDLALLEAELALLEQQAMQSA